jgi:hypothetical protein
MEATSTSEMSVIFYQTTRRNVPEASHLQWKGFQTHLQKHYILYFIE